MPKLFTRLSCGHPVTARHPLAIVAAIADHLDHCLACRVWKAALEQRFNRAE